MDNLNAKFEMYVMASKKLGEFFEGNDIDDLFIALQNGYFGIEDVMIFLPYTSLTLEELQTMSPNEELIATIIQQDSNHIIFTDIHSSEALWLLAKIEENEHINIFNKKDALNKKSFLDLRFKENRRKGIEAFNHTIWLAIEDYLNRLKYDIVFMPDQKIFLMDLQASDQDEVKSKENFLKKVLCFYEEQIKENEYEDLMDFFYEGKNSITEYLFVHYYEHSHLKKALEMLVGKDGPHKTTCECNKSQTQSTTLCRYCFARDILLND